MSTSLDQLAEARRPDGTLVFPSLWAKCFHDRPCGHNPHPRHFADPLEAVGPVLMDWGLSRMAEARENEDEDGGYCISLDELEHPEYLFRFLVTRCLSLGWLKKKRGNNV